MTPMPDPAWAQDQPDVVETHWNIRELDNRFRVTVSEHRYNTYVSVEQLHYHGEGEKRQGYWLHVYNAGRGFRSKIDAFTEAERFYRTAKAKLTDMGVL